MRNINPAFQAALIAGRDTGIVPRRFVWVTAKLRTDGSPVSLGVWTGDEDITLNVIDGVTGIPVTRTYYGAVSLLIGRIPRVSDLTIQTIDIGMSQLATVAQQLVREYDVRLAKVEIHETLLGTADRQPVSNPEIVFLGEVDGAPVTTPSVGQDGAISLRVRSDAISMLTRTNPAKSSFEGQKRRSGDEWGKFASTIASWRIPWGQN